MAYCHDRPCCDNSVKLLMQPHYKKKSDYQPRHSCVVTGSSKKTVNKIVFCVLEGSCQESAVYSTAP